ncbi:MAG: sulfur carrier protein ThiS [Phycisphaerae bacterium]
MRIMVNGQWRDEGGDLTVARLLEALSLEPRRVAVELNKRLVRRADFGLTRLADNDQLEIVTLVGGG